MLPSPPVVGFTLTVEADTTGWGTVTGGGFYPLGDTATIEAFPNTGYEFLYWNDSITDNPLDVVVTQDSTFIAHFGLIGYTITTIANPADAGIVTGGGTYQYGDEITLEAVPNIGFIFERWADGVGENPRTVVVTESQSFTANFGYKQCVITANAVHAMAGYVEGGGTYHYGETISLFAQSNPGYYFDKWEDGIIDNPRQVFVEDNATFTARYKRYDYQITTGCEPEEGGTVFGGGQYHYGDHVELIARPNPNYVFICWNDGIATNPREIIVTESATYKAIFSTVTTYSVKVMPNDPTLGDVTGSGEYPEGTVIEISATPNTHAVFTEWDDGNTENPRRLEVTCDMIIIAMFEALPQYTITVRPQSAAMGSTYGSGSYPQQSVVTIGATPNDGYYFNGWEDGDMSNPRTIIVTADATYVALFTATPVDTYSVTVYYDENQGIILGANTNYPVGATASLVAIPADGYVFVRWSDGTTDNPKEVIVDHDIVLAAFFNYTDVDENGLNAVSLYPNPASDKLHLEGIEGKHDIQIYNAIGMLVKTSSLNGDGEININDLSAGLYLLRINGHTMRFVKK